MESSASRVLRQELRRYCEGKINGRSFLIAGHRGAGKTTLVAKSLLDVLRDTRRPSALRPLFIPLHGPSLFPVERVTARTPDDGVEHADDDRPRALTPQPRRDDDKSEAQIALEQITLGLHRAVSREFADRFRERAEDLAHLRRTPNASRKQLDETLRSRSADPDNLDPQANDPMPTSPSWIGCSRRCRTNANCSSSPRN